MATFDQNVDVVVVGAGGAGLITAIHARHAGASVLVFERNPMPGGSTGISVGSFSASTTAWQRRAKVEDSAEQHFQDSMAAASRYAGKVNEPLMQLLAREAPLALAELVRLGIPFVGPFPDIPGTPNRMHNIVPRAKAYIAVLTSEARRLGVIIVPNTRVIQLARKHDRVQLVTVEESDGRRTTVVARRGVVLAAGDYTSGSELKRKYLPPDVADIPGINATAEGDGHRLGTEVGGNLLNMDIVMGPQLRFVTPSTPSLIERLPLSRAAIRLMGSVANHLPKSLFTPIARQALTVHMSPSRRLFEEGAILVNRSGMRFTNELGSEVPAAIWRQPGQDAFLLFDSRVAEKFRGYPNYISTAPGIAHAFLQDYEAVRPDICRSDSDLERLARTAGIDVSALIETLGEYHRGTEFGTDAQFHRTEGLAPIRGAPYYLLGPVVPRFTTTEGGLAVNAQCEVIDEANRPIPGLYAAGANGQGGLVLIGHGLHIAWAFVSGRIAGRNAATIVSHG